MTKPIVKLLRKSELLLLSHFVKGIKTFGN